MKNRILTTAILAPLSLSLVFVSRPLLAQSTNKAPATKSAAAEKKAVAHPFHGTLTAVDKSAKTITIGKVTYQITSDTKVMKNDKPATLDDGVIGEEAAGYVKPDAAGKLFASSVRFGAKLDAKGTKKK